MSRASDPRKKWDAGKYADTARFVADLAQPVLDLLAPVAGERILDLGCGDGYLTRRIEHSGAMVLGVDGSPEMVAAAVGQGLDARVGDGQDLSFHQEFDAVFSNAALHWMRRADDVIAGVRRALKPGGRFVAECGGLGNIAAVRVAVAAVLADLGIADDAVNANFYPSVDDYRRRLQAQGFVVDSIELIPRPTLVKTGMAAWLDTFRGDAFEQLSTDVAETARSRIVTLLEPVLRDEQGNWWLDYVRLRFRAHLP